MKNGRFSTNISLYVENDTKYGRSYNGRQIVGRSEPFSMTLNDLEWLTKFLVHSKFRCLLTPNKSSAVFSGIARNLIWGLYVLTRSYEKWAFSTNISLYVENDTKYGRSYNGRPIVGRSEPFSMTLNDLEWLTKFLVHSKFRCLLTPNKSSAVFSGVARNLIWGYTF